MKTEPVICDVCDKPMTLGQWMVIVEHENMRLIAHKSNPKIWGRGQLPKTCLDVITERIEEGKI